jgi:hypothetical protein
MADIVEIFTSRTHLGSSYISSPIFILDRFMHD